MARRRTVQVRESVEELQQLRDYYQGTPNAPLMQLLLLLREDQSRTIAECAELCGISVRKAERVWKRYREGGMSGLLNSTYRVNGESLSSQVAINPLGTADPVLLNQIGKVLACELVTEWLLEMRALLYALFPEVDYITLRALTLPADYENQSVHTVASRILLPNGSQQILSVAEGHSNFDIKAYLDEGRRLGIALDQYRDDPQIIEIFWDEKHASGSKNRPSIATFLFFRRKGNGPLPQCVMDRVELLRPFLSAIILRFVKRHVPVDAGWSLVETAIERISVERGMSLTEKKILVLILCGKSYREVANEVSVSVSTVRSHLRSIYQKLGVSSKGETFALLLGFRTD